MKRFLTMLFTTLLLTAALCATASASDFDAVAEDLSAIGMFRGTANGFELDRAPTRSEAAIMLVRLYGAEETAKAAYDAGEISHPFTDVSQFTSPYVAWLYTNGITNGTTATTYGSAKPCSAQNYTVFLLRALGYKDGTDFQYADALAFAQEKGFYSPELFSGTFLRDDLAALTYQGLAADMADGETYLLDSLVKSGAVDAGAAKTMTDKIEAYRAMNDAALDTDAIDMDMDVKMDMTITAEGETMTMPMEMTGNVKTIVDDKGIRAACDMTSSTMGMEVSQKTWLKDGWAYVSMAMGEEEMKYKYRVLDEESVLEQIGAVDPEAMDVSALAVIRSITAEKSGSNTVYTAVIDGKLGGMMTEAVQEALTATGEDAAMDMELSDITVVYTLDRSGAVKSMHMTFDMKMDLSMDIEGETFAMDAAYAIDMDLTVKATGKDVKISFPNFSGYQEMDPGQLTQPAG